MNGTAGRPIQHRGHLWRDDAKTRNTVRAQLERLKSLGLWDGRWDELDNEDHHVSRADVGLKRFWCKGGVGIGLDVREVVKWKARKGIGHNELLEQMEDTPFASALTQELGRGSWTKSHST